jgi:hypothetical protein
MWLGDKVEAMELSREYTGMQGIELPSSLTSAIPVRHIEQSYI